MNKKSSALTFLDCLPDFQELADFEHRMLEDANVTKKRLQRVKRTLEASDEDHSVSIKILTKSIAFINKIIKVENHQFSLAWHIIDTEQ